MARLATEQPMQTKLLGHELVDLRLAKACKGRLGPMPIRIASAAITDHIEIRIA